MNEIILISIIVATINIGILGIILSQYAKMYQRTRAQISLGIMIFSGLMILHNAMTVYNFSDEHYNLVMSVKEQVGVFSIPAVLIIHVAEMAGLLVFLKISLD
jgi:undecaprenyl pyrophosphate phosphatase UppP